MFITLVRQYGAQFTEIDKNRAGHGYVTFNDAENKNKTTEAMTMLKDLFDSKVMGILAFGMNYILPAHSKHKSVMNISSTGGLSNITSCLHPS